MALKRKIKKIHKGNLSEIDMAVVPEAMMLINQWDVSKPVFMEFYNDFSRQAWAMACQINGIYQIITQDLVDFIHHLIKDQNAIEICCGAGILGKALKIPLIDRKVQEEDIAKAYNECHEKAGQQTKIYYPSDVIHMTANKAFREYQPDWVVGAWVTQKLIKGKIGMMFGPMEEEFVENANYIHVGTSHLPIHTHKRVNKYPHYIIEADWLVNRSTNEKPGQMRIWSKKQIEFDSFPEHLEFDYYLPNI